MRRDIPVILLCAVTSACAAPVAETPEPSGVLQAAPPPADASAIPAGSDITVSLTSELHVDRAAVGQTFTTTVHAPLMALNGDTVIPAGSVITGMVTGVDRSTAPGDQAAIRLNFLRIDISGTTHPFSADIVSTQVRAGSVADTARAPADTTAAAVPGAVISGELRDALIDVLGVGAGTIVSLGTGAVAGALPAGTLLTVRTRDTINLRG